MGANQSGDGRPAGNSEAQSTTASGGILVVNPTPGQRRAERSISLPKRTPPILSLESGHQIDANRHKPIRHQLNQDLWMDLTVMVMDFSRSRSELVGNRQAQLQEKIVQIDEHVQRFTNSYVNGKHKALARMNEDCRRTEEMGKMLHKCTLQSELCVNMLNKLNFLLPDEHKLEPLEA